MPLVPFSKKYPDEFLARGEDNFDVFVEKLRVFYDMTRADIQDGQTSRRRLNNRFDYQKELEDIRFNQNGITTEEVASEFNDMLQGCIRHQDPTTAFNIIPSPLLDSIAGITLMSLYNPNSCWDFLSGKICLYEKKITRMLGSLVGWTQADGFIVTGGKQALAYAIKSGIGRATLNNPVEMSELVVVCSASAHYSIEHVCHYLGISPENCIRIAKHESGEMNLKVLEETLQKVISQNKKIAAVIAVAGGTIDLVPDHILSLKNTIDKIAEQNCLDYVPYLHVDSVITWIWLAFENNPDFFSHPDIHPNVTKKIQHVLSKLDGIKYADSFAADFHKTGFCPYAAGVFIVKEPASLLGLTPERFIPKENSIFGDVGPYRQTFENSRSSLPIASIWIALRRMGLEGLRQFVLYQLQVCELFKQKIQENYSDHFEVLNNQSNGWEIVFKPHFRHKLSWDCLQSSLASEQNDYINDCQAFQSDLWYGVFDEGRQCPLIGFIRKYSRKGIHEKGFPAFLIHPTSLHYDDKTIEEMVKDVFEAKSVFDQKCATLGRPLVEEYLCEMTPPR